MGQQKNKVGRGRWWVAIAALLLSVQALAMDAFTIKEIRAEGLERLDLGTVLTYLPLSTGDELNDQSASQAIKALYGTGLFQDVQLKRDGDALVIVVKERPAITKFTLEGNEKIGGDELKKSLKDLGLADGELFKRELLDQVQQELRRQYFANGYYDVSMDTKVTEEPNNRVSIKVEVHEGKPAKIKKINIIGNTVFPTDELVKQFKLEETNWIPFQKSDRYSKQQLGGDLESLQSYYQDRGYLKFAIESVQVALTPDKESIYITMNVDEGQVYTVSGHKFTGETIVGTNLLEMLLTTPNGATFSRKEATESANRIESALSDIGYAFAKVTPVPEVNEDKKQVAINYVVEPGKRAYVRRINFIGHGSTNDETLRREMRQLEASPFSKSAVERSRIRLTRLPFIEDAEVETKPVPGSDDLVDIVFKVKERPPGSVQFGVGFSGAQGFLITASLTHTNFLGTGNRVDLSVDNNSISRSINFSWTDPYFTPDGISQTMSVGYRQSSNVVRYASGFDTNILSFNLIYGIPLSEYANLRLGGGVEQVAMQTYPLTTADEVEQFVLENGSHFTNYMLRSGIGRDTRNRTFFANNGSLNQVNFDASLPGSGVTFYTLTYRGQRYDDLPYKFTLESNASLGYVNAYGNASGVPPYENLFAGGVRTVRGFRDGSLAPVDTPFGNPYGGKLRTTGQFNLFIPMPLESDGKSTRTAVFFDVGNVFAQASDFAVGDLRQSTGVSFAWFTSFLGMLEVSYAFPLNKQNGDRIENFQLNFGTGF